MTIYLHLAVKLTCVSTNVRIIPRSCQKSATCNALSTGIQESAKNYYTELATSRYIYHYFNYYNVECRSPLVFGSLYLKVKDFLVLHKIIYSKYL